MLHKYSNFRDKIYNMGKNVAYFMLEIRPFDKNVPKKIKNYLTKMVQKSIWILLWIAF